MRPALHCLSSLLATDLELTAFTLALPRPRDRSVVEREPFDLPVEDVADRAGLVFRIRLEMDHPSLGVERRVLDRDVVGAGIDRPGNRFAIPVQDDEDVVAMHLARTPRSDPGPLERVAF